MTTMSFANPDWMCDDLRTLPAPARSCVIAGLPAILLSKLDDAGIRRLGGVPFESGQAFVRTPLDGRLQAGGASLPLTYGRERSSR